MMIRFYTNKELSRKFKLNLARWKRWSREFLPPDALGGLQSGFARQYNRDEAFTVFLGGHLVGSLRYTIPEARQILKDLRQWLVDHEFYFDFYGKARSRAKTAAPITAYQVLILDDHSGSAGSLRFFYQIKAIISEEPLDDNGLQMHREIFIRSAFGPEKTEPVLSAAKSYRVLNISCLRNDFLKALESAHRDNSASPANPPQGGF